ncbi:uncharacterized protein LOC125833538 [Solanum verrucosum]|uniref:uncharacterized protein LOC125833538 n=1 Tax=Solanum verrucosum TaxID=315347 RepID=UPI0020D09E3A|nr:uncharacterized protein LOC125833538 [Solanum verrucosum]
MHKDDAEKTAFITSWGIYNYKVMTFGLKNVWATYIRAMTTLFHDMIHKEIEVYVDDVIVKSKKVLNHLDDFCWGIELDPSKIKVIRDLPPPKSKKEKDAAVKWTDECQQAFDKIKDYLSNPAVLVPPESGRLLMLYISVLDNAFSCILGQHDEIGKMEQTIEDLLYNGEVTFVEEDISEEYDGWRMFFDRAKNLSGCGIRVVLISLIGQHYPVSMKLSFFCSNNMNEYEAYILGLRRGIDFDVQEILIIGDSDLLIHQVRGEWATKNLKLSPYLECVCKLCKRIIKTEFRHVPRIQNEIGDALASFSSTIQHPDHNYIDPIYIHIYEQPAYIFHVDEEPHEKPWRTSDLGLLRCIEAGEANWLIEEIHAGTCGPHMNGFTLAKKILRLGYFCSPRPFAAWGMDIISPIEPATSNGQRFILVAIDYFTKWVKATSHKLVTKKVVDDFVKNYTICRFKIPESITDNRTNLNSDLMRSLCEKFEISHPNSTTYRP